MAVDLQLLLSRRYQQADVRSSQRKESCPNNKVSIEDSRDRLSLRRAQTLLEAAIESPSATPLLLAGEHMSRIPRTACYVAPSVKDLEIFMVDARDRK